MEIQFAQTLSDSRGEKLKDVSGAGLTLARACEIALDTPLESDKNEGLTPKLRRARMIENILDAEKEAKPLALSSEDVSLLKERVAQIFTAASTVRRICKLLDPTTE